MQITGTAVYGERTVVNVTKPTTTDGVYLVNSPYEIAIDAAGWAYRFGVVVMLGDPPSEVGALYEANPGAWTVVEGSGPFVVYGDYEITPESTVAAVIGTFSSGNGGIELAHGVILEQCSLGCSTYRVQRVHRYLKTTCDDESGGAS